MSRRESKRDRMVREALESAAEFYRLPRKAISLEREHLVRDMEGFISAACYGRAMSVTMDPHELGVVNGVRYRQKSRKGER